MSSADVRLEAWPSSEGPAMNSQDLARAEASFSDASDPGRARTPVHPLTGWMPPYLNATSNATNTTKAGRKITPRTTPAILSNVFADGLLVGRSSLLKLGGLPVGVGRSLMGDS
jgi:hypothetical protein